MDLNKICKAILFPHIAVMILLLPISTVYLVYCLVCLDPTSLVVIPSYVLAFYTLVIWSIKTPRLIRSFKRFKEENKYARRWQDDPRLRVNITLYGSLLWNTAYAILQLGLGLRHHTFWFYSLAGYYFCLAVMRFFLAQYTIKHKPGENMRAEFLRYRLCGWVFLLMNLALALMIFFMVHWNRTFRHHPITTIALAAYTFTSFTMAVINIVKYRKLGSPVFSASKAISFASACVSMLTLEATMLTTFSDGTMDAITRNIFLGCTGGSISVFVILMSIYMIRKSSKTLKTLQ